MTISSEVRKAGPYSGNGSTTQFPFSFKVFSASDVLVVRTNPLGAESNLVLGTDYTVALNANQDANPGGTITTTTAPATGYLITATSQVQNLQPVTLTNQGGFYPQVINNALDRLTILAQQNAEQIVRSVKVPISSSVTPDSLIAQLTSDADAAATSATAAANSATAAAASEGAAAGSATAAAASATAADASEAAAAASESAAATSATNAANSATAASNSATTATTQAGNAATSATAAANSATAAGTSETNAASSATAAAASYDSFDDRYLGAKAADPTTDNDGNALLVGALYWNSTAGQMRAWDGATWQVAYMPGAGVVYGLFYKADPTTVAFTKTGAGTASIKAGTKVDVAGTTVTFVADTAITMPTLTAGTDYAIWVRDDATIQATTDFSSAPGAGNWRKIGGFHYGLVAPGTTPADGSFATTGFSTTGGNMVWTQADVDRIAGINEFSIWDLVFRSKGEQHGMTFDPQTRTWWGIYLCSTNHIANGISRYNTDVASGTVLPRIPLVFGGNGTNTYGRLSLYEAVEIAASHGCRLPSYEEFMSAAFGVTEGQSLGGASSTIPATARQPGYTSRIGIEQATGHHWIIGAPFGSVGGSAWSGTGRGSLYGTTGLPLFGGSRADAADSGSRCSNWYSVAWYSGWIVGLRAACDHLNL